jgi:hypothetical protein
VNESDEGTVVGLADGTAAGDGGSAAFGFGRLLDVAADGLGFGLAGLGDAGACARTLSGLNFGRPCVPSTLVAPKIHRSTLPGLGL